mgnify:CR=1 FL=1
MECDVLNNQLAIVGDNNTAAWQFSVVDQRAAANTLSGRLASINGVVAPQQNPQQQSSSQQTANIINVLQPQQSS